MHINILGEVVSVSLYEIYVTRARQIHHNSQRIIYVMISAGGGGWGGNNFQSNGKFLTAVKLGAKGQEDIEGHNGCSPLGSSLKLKCPLMQCMCLSRNGSSLCHLSNTVAQCSVTPPIVAATPPCSATPCQRQLDVSHLWR